MAAGGTRWPLLVIGWVITPINGLIAGQLGVVNPTAQVITPTYNW